MSEKAIDLKIEVAIRARFLALEAVIDTYCVGDMEKIEVQRRLRPLGYSEAFIEELL